MINYSNKFRNRLAKRLCDWVLIHIADDDYGSKVQLVIDQGMYHAIHGDGPFIIDPRQEAPHDAV